jgi:hypothetical protein
MENNTTTTIEKLIEKAEIYSKTTLDLIKCETVYKSADIFSNLAVKLSLAFVVVVVLLFMNIGLAFFIGKQLGEVYYGFLAVGFAYLLILIVLFIFKDAWIKNPVSNFIISKMNNQDSI